MMTEYTLYIYTGNKRNNIISLLNIESKKKKVRYNQKSSSPPPPLSNHTFNFVPTPMFCKKISRKYIQCYIIQLMS